ncbi:hypothetical protein QWZ14_20505 [Paeniroseomonas aquatica]|uniref:Uncharacterized protein n=1 Tax=Paeniroseomonas aquatica TaxID=373043 RepID=A0ABT8AAL7_9PROT|nr:hypothetical protein [Paeniroseomonas aquatica]MDN3566764.1 hypothetical protein [Paeniroseomonas aquatica]
MDHKFWRVEFTKKLWTSLHMHRIGEFWQAPACKLTLAERHDMSKRMRIERAAG